MDAEKNYVWVSRILFYAKYLLFSIFRAFSAIFTLRVEDPFKTENCFCVLVNVHKVAKTPEVPCKQYVSTEKNIEVPKNFMAFLRTLVIALTIHVRIMSICCCPVQIFAIN